jgi:hypothetical protein
MVTKEGVSGGRVAQLGEHLFCKEGDSFQAFHVLLTFLLFPTNWGICFSFKANPKGLNLTHKCTVRAR